MTFAETDHPRVPTGQFKNKINAAPSSDLASAGEDDRTAEARHIEASKEYRQHDTSLAALALRYLDEGMPDQAHKVVFGWSDQGDYLTVEAACDQDGNDVLPDLEESDELETVNSVAGDLPHPTQVQQLVSDRHGQAFTWTRQAPSKAGAHEDIESMMLELSKDRLQALLRSEAAAVDAIIEGLPAEVAEVVFESSDQGEFLTIADAIDGGGNSVYDYDDEVWDELEQLASNVQSGHGYFDQDAKVRDRWTYRRPATSAE